MRFKTVLCLPVCLLVASAAFATLSLPKDSVGVERRGKVTLVLHKVESGETLYSLARRYRASVSQIKSANPGLGDALKMGAVVKVPYAGNTSATASSGQAATRENTMTAPGKTHRVSSGEGLFSIARKYNVPVSDLRKWNSLSSDELRIGQDLIVSNGDATDKRTRNTSGPIAEKPAITAGAKTHTVANGEGLFNIARKYNVSVGELRRWNALRSDNIDIGQQLVVAEPSDAMASAQVARTEPKPTTRSQEISEPVKTAAIDHRTEKRPPVAAVVDEARPEAAEANPAVVITPTAARPSESIGNKEEEKPAPLVVNNSGYVKTVEAGMAEAITDGAGNDLFLALHRTAPVGTIMQVRNEMNDQSVFVKVIGKLPDTGDNDKVIVKISNRAYERLAAVDRRFRVQISYMPQQ